MKVHSRLEADVQVVVVEGEVDLETSPQLRKVLMGAVSKGNGTIVDLSGVPYMDSSGIACLVEAYQKARTAGGRFVLAQVGDTVLSTLKLAKLNRVFTITDDLRTALDKG